MAENPLTCPSCGKDVPAEVTPGEAAQCPACGAGLSAQNVPGDLTGKTVAGHEILSRIGEGGMGIVYLAEQISLKRKVAFKVLKVPTHFEEFRREAVAAARISHPNIVSVFDIAQDAGVTFITMEYVDGVSLRDLLKKSGAVPIPRALAMVRQVLAALVRAHRDGLIHRDIKPENILVDRDGLLKVADFGLAQFLERASGAESSASAPVSRRGTPCYVSPEQARGNPCDARTDIYSTGVVLYELLHGEPPYTGGSPREVMKKVLNDPVPELAAASPNVPKELSALVGRMMAKSPDERPVSAEDILRELGTVEQSAGLSESSAFSSSDWQRAYVRALSGPEIPESEADRRRRWVSAWPSLVAVAAAVLALVVAGYAYRHLGKAVEEPEQPAVIPLPTPVITAEPPVPEPPPDQFKAEYQAAAEYARAHPEEYARIITLFESVARSGSGTPYGDRAAQDAGIVRKRWRSVANEALLATKASAERLAAAEKFGDALSACTLPEHCQGAGLEKELEKLREDILAQAAERTAALTNACRAHLDENRFDLAKANVAALLGFGVPESTQAARRLEQEVERRKQETEELWAYDAKVDWFLILRETGRLTALRQHNGALAFVNERIEDPRYVAVTENLYKERNGIALAQDTYSRVMDYVRAHPGTELRIRGILGTFAGMRDGVITINTDVGPISDDATNISHRDIVRLADAALQGREDAQIRFALGVFLLYDGRYSDAEREFKRASGAGKDLAYYQWRLTLASENAWAEVRKPAVAERALFLMRKAHEREDWRQVISQVNELMRLPNELAVVQNRTEINAAAETARQKLGGADKPSDSVPGPTTRPRFPRR